MESSDLINLLINLKTMAGWSFLIKNVFYVSKILVFMLLVMWSLVYMRKKFSNGRWYENIKLWILFKLTENQHILLEIW